MHLFVYLFMVIGVVAWISSTWLREKTGGWPWELDLRTDSSSPGGLLTQSWWLILICIVVVSISVFGCDCFTTIKQAEMTQDDLKRVNAQIAENRAEYRRHIGSGKVPIEELDSVLEFKKDSK